ncbi:OpgC domain-containing protein [Paracoccus sp. SCSIO 75233]|uniref:OpgC domain-containing protein n=1 Tax=Paracoccus sp. SCSIO 75233 TaxID=3017782 RepID=UPI0022F039C9|nr:OpgC domain-containing protein [Paracoccus sp. SCSIO 75233]WBU54309.1 OpgC domain-containing protein [Paracoccus sp. SCSIO 75233]
MNRIIALDMLRGYALVAIMLDHMPDSALRRYTLSNFAVFDAAELFVLLSGFLVGLVWLTVETRDGRRAAQWRFLRRAVQVWLALVLGGVLMALTSRLLFELDMPHTAIWSQYARWVIENPLGYIGTLATMWMQPNLLDVLALYVVVLAFVPLTVPLLKRYPWAFAAGSALMWYFAEPLNAMLPNHRSQGGMLFNPFGWQALFHAGVAMGLFRQQFMPVLRRHARLLTILATLIMIYSLGLAQLWRHGPEIKQYWEVLRAPFGAINKWSLDPVRFTAILAAAWLVAVPLSGLFARLAGTALGRALATIGRGGLVSFVACVILSVLGDALMNMNGDPGWSRSLAVDLWTLGALWLVAELNARRSTRSRQPNRAGA